MRDCDVELFEDTPEQYVSQDLEGKMILELAYCIIESIQDWSRRFHIQLKDRLLSLINPV